MNLLRKLRALFRRQALDREMADEMRFHLEQRAADNVDDGMSPEEARYAARRKFGGAEQIKERCRDGRRIAWFEEASQDLRYGARQLRRSPLFTSVVVLTLAVAIGANTAVFSLVDAVLLKPLPVRASEELVLARWQSGPNPPIAYLTGEFSREQSGRMTGAAFSDAAFVAMRDNQQTLAAVFGAAAASRMSMVAEGGEAEMISAHWVSGDFFSSLGVAAEAGRLFSMADDRPEAEPVAVISYECWQRRFGGSQSIADQRLLLNGRSVSIIGALPRNFAGTLQFGDSPDLYLPLGLERQWAARESLTDSPAAWWIQVMGRLKPGVSREQAQADLAGIFQATLAVHADSTGRRDLPVLVLDRGDQGYTQRRGELKPPLLVLIGISALTLAIACATTAGLMLARGHRRRREIGVRLALGASAGRLVRQLLMEALLIGVLAGTTGFLIALWCADFLAAQLLGAGSTTIELDGHVLLFTAAISLLVTTGAGLVPALQAARLNLVDALKQGRMPARSRPSILRWGAGVVVAQVALAFVLLTGAVLLVRTLHNLMSTERRLDERQILMGKIDPTLAGSAQQQRVALEQIAERIRALPGVDAVALSRHHLLGDKATTVRIGVPQASSLGAEAIVHANWVAGDYFKATGVALKQGRLLSRFDDHAKVVLVNETFVRAFLSEQSPVGGVVSGNQIVGVVADARYGSMRAPAPPTIYFPFGATAHGVAAVTILSSGAVDSAAMRKAAAEVNALLPVFDVRSFKEQRKHALSRDRLLGEIASAFAAIATLLALFGVFGLISYTVGCRHQELGIRIALGATSRAILCLVFREAVVVAAVGTSIGAIVALGVMQWLRSALYGISPHDALTYVAVGLGFAGAIAIAAWVPARRAAKVDPMTVLKAE